MKAIFKVLIPAISAGLMLLASISSAFAAEIRFTLGEYSSNTKTSFEKIARAFEAENPGIKINIDVIPWSTYQQALVTDISGNNAPDISVLASIWLADFADQGLIEPMANVMNPKLKDVFIPALLDPSMIEGELMGLPIAASARGMMINNALYKKAGVKPPTTWEELATASKEISKLKGAYGFGLPGRNEEIDVYYYYALWSFGGEIFDENGKSGLSSPEALAAANTYADLVKSGYTQPSPTANSRDDVFNLFKQGKLGTIFTFPMLVPQIKAEAPDLDYSVLPFPVGTRKVTMGITDSVAVFKSSAAKPEIRKFLDFMFKKEHRFDFNKADGLLPVTKEVVAMDYYQQDKDIKAFADGLAYAKFQPIMKGWDEIIDITQSALHRIYLLEQTPEVAFQEAASKINKLRGN